MNIFKKIWSPKNQQIEKENVTLVNIIRFNDNCDSNSETFQRKNKDPKMESTNNIKPIKLINKSNNGESFSRKMHKFSVGCFSKKKSSALTLSDLERKLTDPIELIKRTHLQQSKLYHRRCAKSYSLMATIKYKDPEFMNRRTRAAISVYLLDHLMESKRIEFLENQYGGKFVAHRSAKIIQRYFRNYIVKKTTQMITSDLTTHSPKLWIDELNNSRFSEFSLDSIDMRSINNVPDDPFEILNNNERKRLYFLGKNIFNRNCNKGISFLIHNGILDSEAESVVKFLNSKDISSYAKGDYLSQDNNLLALATRKEFTRKMSFEDCSIENGVRKLFSHIRIPGETQKILNMLEEFSKVYLCQNPHIQSQLKKEDTVVLIAFAILMLHTSIYNPSASKQDKMTKEQFIRIFKGINEEEFVSENYLSELYDNVKKKQMKSLSDHTDVVRTVLKSLTGSIPKDLIQNYRKLICEYTCNEIPHINKKPNSHSHSRVLYLFNDLLLITKRGKSNGEYHVRHAIQLLGLQISPFKTEYYENGLDLIQIGQKKQMIHLDCIKLRSRDKLQADLSTYIDEVSQLDKFRASEEMGKFNTLNDKVN